MKKIPVPRNNMSAINAELQTLFPPKPVFQSRSNNSEIRRNRKRLGLPEVEPPPPGLSAETAPQFLMEALRLLSDIQDALGTRETGKALVGVARNAHQAEQELAMIKRRQDGEGPWPNPPGIKKASKLLRERRHR